MATLQLASEDLAALVTALVRPRVERVVMAVARGRLQVELTGIQTGLPVIGSLNATLSLRAGIEGPAVVGVDVQLEKVLGPLTLLVRPLMKQVLQAMIPDALRPAMEVESRHRVVVYWQRLALPVMGMLGEQLALGDLEAPHGAAGLLAVFTVKEMVKEQAAEIAKEWP